MLRCPFSMPWHAAAMNCQCLLKAHCFVQGVKLSTVRDFYEVNLTAAVVGPPLLPRPNSRRYPCTGSMQTDFFFSVCADIMSCCLCLTRCSTMKNWCSVLFYPGPEGVARKEHGRQGQGCRSRQQGSQEVEKERRQKKEKVTDRRCAHTLTLVNSVFTVRPVYHSLSIVSPVLVVPNGDLFVCATMPHAHGSVFALPS